ncbi:MAG: hypothetical protein C4332_01250 [Meiothermus sp.]
MTVFELQTHFWLELPSNKVFPWVRDYLFLSWTLFSAYLRGGGEALAEPEGLMPHRSRGPR